MSRSVVGRGEGGRAVGVGGGEVVCGVEVKDGLVL